MNTPKAPRTVWSVVAVTSTGRRGKLMFHVDGTDALTLSDAVPFVDTRAAARVAAPNAHREVCAWVIGTLPDGTRVAVYRNLQRSTAVQPPASGAYVTYDRAACAFVTRPDNTPWHGSAAVTFTDRMRAV